MLVIFSKLPIPDAFTIPIKCNINRVENYSIIFTLKFQQFPTDTQTINEVCRICKCNSSIESLLENKIITNMMQFSELLLQFNECYLNQGIVVIYIHIIIDMDMYMMIYRTIEAVWSIYINYV